MVLKEFYESMIENCQSVMLSTVDSEGIPNASYAPFVLDDAGNFHINISGMAKHTANLYDCARASVLLIEDERQSETLFSRKRITFECEAELLERETPEWEVVMERFETRFGEIIQGFRQMHDFRIFRLKPRQGLAVMGFGKAYRFDGALPSMPLHVGASHPGDNPHANDMLKR